MTNKILLVPVRIEFLFQEKTIRIARVGKSEICNAMAAGRNGYTSA